MRKFCWIMGILCDVLTLIGAGYVLYHDGQVSAGYACVPMTFSLLFTNLGSVKNDRRKLK